VSSIRASAWRRPDEALHFSPFSMMIVDYAPDRIAPMTRAPVAIFAAASLLAGCESTAPSGSAPFPVPPRVREPTLGLTGAKASCAVDALAGSTPSATCTAQAVGAPPPSPLRMALVWNRTAPAKHLVVEYGPTPGIPAPFRIELPIPPDAGLDLAFTPPGATPTGQRYGLATFMIYEDLNENEHLDLVAEGIADSPDRILGVARHIILYYPGRTPAFAIMESSPRPNLNDCVASRCELPFDFGSQLLEPGKPIEIVAVGPETQLYHLCDSFYAGRDPWPRTNPRCSSPPTPDDGVICRDSTAWVGRCAPTLPCHPGPCTFCEASLGDAFNPCTAPTTH
jgi:hypothetical protein